MDYLTAPAATEGLDLETRTGNPTRAGIHAKWLLAQIDGVQWSAVGSLKGGEISHKVDREVMLMVDQPFITEARAPKQSS